MPVSTNGEVHFMGVLIVRTLLSGVNIEGQMILQLCCEDGNIGNY